MTRNRTPWSLDAALRNPRGVTLLEILVGLSLLVAVLGFTYEFLTSGQRAALTTRDSFQVQGQLRAALDNMVDEIRWGQTVTAASATSVTLTIPQATPFSPTSPYTVTFAFDAINHTVTRRQDAGAAQPVAYSIVKPDGGGGLQIEYYDAASTSLGSTPSDLTVIARVRLTVTSTKSNTSRTFVGDAALRGR